MTERGRETKGREREGGERETERECVCEREGEREMERDKERDRKREGGRRRERKQIQPCSSSLQIVHLLSFPNSEERERPPHGGLITEGFSEAKHSQTLSRFQRLAPVNCLRGLVCLMACSLVCVFVCV